MDGRPIVTPVGIRSEQKKGFVVVIAKIERIGTGEEAWGAIVCSVEVWLFAVFCGTNVVHSGGYVGKGEVWWCEQRGKGCCELGDHVFPELFQ